MGREIRMVPPNWEHPTKQTLQYTLGTGYGYNDVFKPMYDRDFDDAAYEWKKELAEWEDGEKVKHPNEDGSLLEYWEWNGQPPDREYYRPWKDEDATWYQLWETVSEGTPVSPPFATKEELANYLATYGDFWDQRRGDPAWGIERATAFVNAGRTPSFAVIDGSVLDSKDIPLAID